VQWEVLSATGLRSIWAIDLPVGRDQVRVASIDLTTGHGGSVYLDVDIPAATRLPPGMLVASRFLSVMPTVFADERLTRWTNETPTATRVFPEGDTLTITVPHAAEAPATARLSTQTGEVAWQGSGAQIEGASAARFVVSLGQASSPQCDLTIQSSYGVVHTAIGVVPAKTPGRQYSAPDASNASGRRH
jgi:hypothetical protein